LESLSFWQPISSVGTATFILVPSEALYGAATFDDDDLYTYTIMPVQLPGIMFL
jgi:hypothetical protein